MKVLVSDYDKTLDVNIDENIKSINTFREEGNIFVIATGRSLLDINKKINEYNINYDYLLINHGATIIDKNNNILSNIIINDVNKIINDLDLESSVRYFCTSGLESRVDFDHSNITKINIKYETECYAEKVNQLLNEKYDNINSYHISPYSIEIISSDIDKSKAINILKDILKITKEDIYTVGDGPSDYKMIKEFNGYSMNESIDELKKISKSVSSVSELINLIKK